MHEDKAPSAVSFPGARAECREKSRDNGFSSIHTKAAVFSKTRKRFLLFDFRVNMKSLTFSNKIKIYCGLNIFFRKIFLKFTIKMQ